MNKEIEEAKKVLEHMLLHAEATLLDEEAIAMEKILKYIKEECIAKQKIRNKIKELSKNKGDLATYIAVSERIKVLYELLNEEE